MGSNSVETDGTLHAKCCWCVELLTVDGHSLFLQFWQHCMRRLINLPYLTFKSVVHGK